MPFPAFLWTTCRKNIGFSLPVEIFRDVLRDKLLVLRGILAENQNLCPYSLSLRTKQWPYSRVEGLNHTKRLSSKAVMGPASHKSRQQFFCQVLINWSIMTVWPIFIGGTDLASLSNVCPSSNYPKLFWFLHFLFLSLLWPCRIRDALLSDCHLKRDD